MSFELIYEEDNEGQVFWLLRNEFKTMQEIGLCARTKPSSTATRLLRRGRIVDEENFPKDPRYVQNSQIYGNCCYINRWYPVIEDLTIPTVFCNQLGPEAILLAKQRNWNRVFIKNSVKSLVEENPLDSVWPDVPLEILVQKFSQNPRKGPYALRQYLPPETFEKERRFWVMGNRIHHSSSEVPKIVKEAASRLSQLGGVFYTIDATPELIVEINAGESSDRKTDNRAEDFAQWIKDAFDRDP